MRVMERDPIIVHQSPQSDIGKGLLSAGGRCAQKHAATKLGPDMMLVILPDLGNAEIYRAVKHFGDIKQGVVTQCLKASKCARAREQYWANVCLKLNPKLGGINVALETPSAALISDPQNPTIILGADVMHPAPGSDAPSFAAVVGSVDSRAVKYVPRMSVQTSRQEIIADLHQMATSIITDAMDYQKNFEKKSPQDCRPKRLLFFRDGVSEGQFAEVKEKELDILKKVCADLKISPKITFLVVGKRHHFRFFPRNPTQEQEADRNSGNCLAGTVVDTGITHPLEFDWYLQSHGGLLGTSRSAHYSVLHDDNNFTADSLQTICYMLCYIYARSTRSVSIPAPVYYADIVCSRAKNHYDPSDGASTIATDDLESYMTDFKPLHRNHTKKMYFM
jgi:eukaryotic translation initiation factor 2C